MQPPSELDAVASRVRSTLTSTTPPASPAPTSRTVTTSGASPFAADDVRSVETPSDGVWVHADDVARLARQLCRHREDAEDVAQSSLLKAAEHIDGFRGESTMRTWLHRITTNECRMLRRRQVARSLDDILEHSRLDAEMPTS